MIFRIYLSWNPKLKFWGGLTILLVDYNILLLYIINQKLNPTHSLFYHILKFTFLGIYLQVIKFILCIFTYKFWVRCYQGGQKYTRSGDRLWFQGATGKVVGYKKVVDGVPLGLIIYIAPEGGEIRSWASPSRQGEIESP